MPRRASSGINLGQILGIAGAILGFLVAAFLLIRVVGGDLLGGGGKSNGGLSSSQASELQIGTYIDNANSLRGNVYKVSGKVEEILKYTPDRGRLITLDASGDGNTALLPVLVPETFSGVNIDRGTQFTFVVRVDRGGILVAEQIEQS
ncbi:MAG: hypothetical protein KDM63_05860 [Verrucomicrobiae bacterium]|nr:hypothetical protein [Verrucomicrobiae bacterium]MCB1086550.1 hypothetical protein [Verrucomicrobiae bacterium]